MFKNFFDTIFSFIGLPAVKVMEWLKRTFSIETYMVENIFVFITLAITVVVTNSYDNLWKWVELLAVFFTFQHASVSQRLEERQHKHFEIYGKADVDGYYKLQRYLVGKELLWMATFIYLQAWAALVGVVIMLAYYPWRTAWRKYHPVKMNREN